MRFWHTRGTSGVRWQMWKRICASRHSGSLRLMVCCTLVDTIVILGEEYYWWGLNHWWLINMDHNEQNSIANSWQELSIALLEEAFTHGGANHTIAIRCVISPESVTGLLRIWNTMRLHDENRLSFPDDLRSSCGDLQIWELKLWCCDLLCARA